MLEQIKEIVAESLNVEADTLTTDTSFKEDLGADSLDLFELVMAFEEAFEIEIPSEDLEEINREAWHGLQNIIWLRLYRRQGDLV